MYIADVGRIKASGIQYEFNAEVKAYVDIDCFVLH